MNKSKSFGFLFLNCWIGWSVIVLMGILLGTMFFLSYCGHDDFEHGASAWFIFNGFVPYRDFFQHHHPLLWYLMTPVYSFLAHPVDIIYIGRIIAAFFFFGGCFLIGKIVLAFGGISLSVLYALFVYLSYPTINGIYIQNRPDTYMIFFLLWGLYNWILFYQQHKIHRLIQCYLMFFIAFAFLQKALWLLLPFGLYQLFLLVKKQIKWGDFLWACLIPAICSLGYVCYLIASNSLARYWELNWIVNLHWFRNYQTYQYSGLDYFYTTLAVLFCLFSTLKSTSLLRGLSIVFLGFAFIFLPMPKPYWYYWTIWTPFAAIIIGLGLGQLISSSRYFFKMIAVGILIFSCVFTAFNTFVNVLILDTSGLGDKEIKALSQQLKPGNQVVDYSGLRANFLRSHPAHYYWFTLERGPCYDIALFHRHTMPDWDDVIYKTKPQFIMYRKLFDKRSTDDNNFDHPMMGVDMKWLKQNYQYIKKFDVWERIDK